MFWVKDTEIDEAGTKWYIYNYFEIIEIGLSKEARFNPITRMYTHTPTQELAIKAAMSPSKEEFEVWYEVNKKL